MSGHILRTDSGHLRRSDSTGHLIYEAPPQPAKWIEIHVMYGGMIGGQYQGTSPNRSFYDYVVTDPVLRQWNRPLHNPFADENDQDYWDGDIEDVIKDPAWSVGILYGLPYVKWDLNAISFMTDVALEEQDDDIWKLALKYKAIRNTDHPRYDHDNLKDNPDYPWYNGVGDRPKGTAVLTIEYEGEADYMERTKYAVDFGDTKLQTFGLVEATFPIAYLVIP